MKGDQSLCVSHTDFQDTVYQGPGKPQLKAQLEHSHREGKNPSQILIIYNLFNKLMSFKIQCQSIMQLNMPAMFVMRHLCSRCIGGAPQLLVVPGINARAGLVSALLHSQCRRFLHGPPSYPYTPKHTHIRLKNTPNRYLHTITLQ